jgi:enterochelin esterase-like enzyme/dienelactone hydrolase
MNPWEASMSATRLFAALVLALTANGVVLAGDDEEHFADGSTGRVTEFRASGGLAIPAYVRKPKGDGPFPVVVLLHGGTYRKGASAGMGRSTRAPVADFIQAGWAVYCTDYRPSTRVSIEPIETDDTVEAIKAVRKLPFVDARHVGLWGASHGANVASRVIARVDLSGAILCAPAALDLIEVKKADGRGEPVVPILRKLIADMEAKHGARAEEIARDPARYKYSSALTEIDKVRCPLLIVNARDDDNSPVSIMELYVGKLRAASKQVETYFPPKGGHGFYVGRYDGPEYQESARRSVAFFTERFGPKKPALDQYGSLDWVDPERTTPKGTSYKTFHSKTIDADVSYLVYLPPEYEKEPTTRYPVLYYLHASGGTPRRDAPGIVGRLDAAVRAGRVPPLIIVFPNGLRGATMYCDTKDGKYPVESVLVKDLIPHVDATYRTVAGRHGRAVDGFSMGGFGAAHLGFKYPEVFGVVSIQAPPLLGPDLVAPLPARAWSRLFPTAMDGDLAYFRANDPLALVPRNADALRDRSVIRIIAHDEDEHWLVPRCEELHRLLLKHGIAHQFFCLTNVKAHSPIQVWDTLGDAGLMFYGSAFNYLSSRPSVPTGRTSAFEVGAVIKKIDVEKGVVVFMAGGMDRSAMVVKDAKVLDEEGKPLADGLGAKQLQPGTLVTLTIQGQGGKPALQVIRLGKKRPPPPAKAGETTEAGIDTSKLTPLTDLGGGKYQGFAGGLYPEGKNERPAGHEAAGLALAKRVQPLDRDGKPSKEGKIVLLGVGFSNTVQVFNGFMNAAADGRDFHPQVVLVNGAMGGMSARMVQDPDDKGTGTKYWSRVDEQLKAALVTRAQVQVVWIKETNPAPHEGGFPKYTAALQAELTRIVQVLPKRFPNVKLVYLSSRTYGGWAKAPPGRPGGPGNSEPYSYETGFAVKWLIEQQLEGKPELNYDPKQGDVKAPWLSWGPYLWANGASKRKDGFHFEPSDFRENDRMHHSPQGQAKTGRMLLLFFKTDTTSKGWFVK